VEGAVAGRQFRCGKCRTVFTFGESRPPVPRARPPRPPSVRVVPRRRAAAIVAAVAAGAVAITLAATGYRQIREEIGQARAAERQALEDEGRARRALADREAEHARELARLRRTASALVRVGRLALDHGEWDGALDSLNAALDHDPGRVEARYLRALALVGLEEYAGGAAELAAYGRARPEDEDARALGELCRSILARETAPRAAPRLFAQVLLRRREFALAAAQVRRVEERAAAYRELLSQALPGWRDGALTVGAEGTLRLDLAGGGLSDLTPLRDLLVDDLVLDGNPVSDLGPLREMPLRSLSLSHTAVADLEPLAGMPLEFLSLDFTAVSDLSPLRGAPLRCVSLLRTPVRDVSALAGAPLEVLQFEPRAVLSGVEFLRSISTLVRVGSLETGGMPAEEFWSRYDVLR
jgi:tetratricopeptide (TPR) repeat protein